MDYIYEVKFKLNGETRYGIVQSYSDEAKKYEKQGKYIVDDAILPESYIIPKKDVVPIKTSFKPMDEFRKYVEEEARKAQELSDSLSGGVQVGALFDIGVADGSATYVVTKVGKKTCQVEWRGFCLDRYTDHHFGWGGKFSVSDVARYVRRPGAKPLPSIFGS